MYFIMIPKDPPEGWEDLASCILGAMDQALQPKGNTGVISGHWAGNLFPIYNDADNIYDKNYNLWAWLSPFLPDDPYRRDDLFDVSCNVLPSWNEDKLFEHLGGAIVPVIHEMKETYPPFWHVVEKYSH